MHLVTRFVAEAIIEQVSDDAILEDSDEGISVHAVPSSLDMQDIEAYVSRQHGETQAGQDDIDSSFDGVDMTSNLLTEFFWEA